MYSEYVNPTLSFTPYTLQGYTNIAPRSLPEVGEIILVSDDFEDWCMRIFDRMGKNNAVLDSTDSPWNFYKRFKEIK